MATTLSLLHALGKPETQQATLNTSQQKSLIQESNPSFESFDVIFSNLIAGDKKDSFPSQKPQQESFFSKISIKDHVHEKIKEESFVPKKTASTPSTAGKNRDVTHDVSKEQKMPPSKEKNQSVFQKHAATQKVTYATSSNTEEEHDAKPIKISKTFSSLPMEEISTISEQEDIPNVFPTVHLMIPLEKPLPAQDDLPNIRPNTQSFETKEISEHHEKFQNASFLSEGIIAQTQDPILTSLQSWENQIPSLEKTDNTLSFGDFGATVIGSIAPKNTSSPFPIFQIASLQDEGEIDNTSSVLPQENSILPLKAEKDPHILNADLLHETSITSTPQDDNPIAMPIEERAAQSLINSAENDGSSIDVIRGDIKGGIARATERLDLTSSSDIPLSTGEESTQNFQKIYSQITQSLKDAMALRNPTFHLRLTPEGLGEVSVQLSFEKQRVEAMFHVSPSGFDILRHQRDAISAIFEAQGFHSDQNSLQFSMNQDPRQFTQQQPFSSHQSPQNDPYTLKDETTSLRSMTPRDRQSISFQNPHGTFFIDA